MYRHLRRLTLAATLAVTGCGNPQNAQLADTPIRIPILRPIPIERPPVVIPNPFPIRQLPTLPDFEFVPTQGLLGNACAAVRMPTPSLTLQEGCGSRGGLGSNTSALGGVIYRAVELFATHEAAPTAKKLAVRPFLLDAEPAPTLMGRILFWKMGSAAGTQAPGWQDLPVRAKVTGALLEGRAYVAQSEVSLNHDVSGAPWIDLTRALGAAALDGRDATWVVFEDHRQRDPKLRYRVLTTLHALADTLTSPLDADHVGELSFGDNFSWQALAPGGERVVMAKGGNYREGRTADVSILTGELPLPRTGPLVLRDVGGLHYELVAQTTSLGVMQSFTSLRSLQLQKSSRGTSSVEVFLYRLTGSQVEVVPGPRASLTPNAPLSFDLSGLDTQRPGDAWSVLVLKIDGKAVAPFVVKQGTIYQKPVILGASFPF